MCFCTICTSSSLFCSLFPHLLSSPSCCITVHGSMTVLLYMFCCTVKMENMSSRDYDQFRFWNERGFQKKKIFQSFCLNLHVGNPNTMTSSLLLPEITSIFVPSTVRHDGNCHQRCFRHLPESSAQAQGHVHLFCVSCRLPAGYPPGN